MAFDHEEVGSTSQASIHSHCCHFATGKMKIQRLWPLCLPPAVKTAPPTSLRVTHNLLFLYASTLIRYTLSSTHTPPSHLSISSILSYSSKETLISVPYTDLLGYSNYSGVCNLHAISAYLTVKQNVHDLKSYGLDRITSPRCDTHPTFLCVASFGSISTAGPLDKSLFALFDISDKMLLLFLISAH